jgi:hypothetical protein
MNKNIFTLLKKIIYFLIPFIFLLLLYVILDPFKVIRKYDSYYKSGEAQVVTLNRDYVSTATFDHYYPLYQYNSFILGNSRSIFYEITDWKNHIKSNSNCFHFDASGESLYGIYKKVKYLDNKNADINNVLLIIDYETLNQITPRYDYITVISPQLENDTNIRSFHWAFIKAFLTPKFMIAYLDYKISGKIKPYMKREYLLDDRPANYELKTNELSFPYFEQLIEKGDYYTPERMKVFYERETVQIYSPKIIFDEQKQMLQEINDVLRKHKTGFKIVVNPLYNQIKLNESDLTYLYSLFGKENVFDFSGINEITNNFLNYYEASHYRPHVARQIMDSIYQ